VAAACAARQMAVIMKTARIHSMFDFFMFTPIVVTPLGNIEPVRAVHEMTLVNRKLMCKVKLYMSCAHKKSKGFRRSKT